MLRPRTPSAVVLYFQPRVARESLPRGPVPATTPEASNRGAAHWSVHDGRWPRWPLLAGVVWAAAVGVGIYRLNRYENTPGLGASAPQQWPTDTEIARTRGQPTLVMFAHPHCPCTRASIGELAILMARAQGLASATVLFGAPTDFPAGWHETDLWQTAAAIPGVTVMADPDGREAQRFGAATSGQTLLYDASGRLQFDGGITDGRGHSGDNVGRATLLALLTDGPAAVRAGAAVFGCPLVLASDAEALESRQ